MVKRTTYYHVDELKKTLRHHIYEYGYRNDVEQLRLYVIAEDACAELSTEYELRHEKARSKTGGE